MTAKGHEGAFPRPRPSDRSLFSQATFAGAGANGEVAPIPNLHAVAPEWEGSVLKRGLLGRLFACAARHDSD